MHTKEAWENAKRRAKARKPNAPISHAETRCGSDGDVTVDVPKGTQCAWSRHSGSWSAELVPANEFAMLGSHIHC